MRVYSPLLWVWTDAAFQWEVPQNGEAHLQGFTLGSCPLSTVKSIWGENQLA